MKKILNFGSISIDYAYEVPYFVRPGETLAAHGRKVSPGGKGLNQSVALAKAGAPVYHAGRVGPDGDEPLEVLAASGADISYTDRQGSATGNAFIQVDETGQNCIILFPGANHELDEAAIDAVLSHFSAGDILLLQNETSGVAHCMQQAARRGMLVAFNPSPITPGLEKLPLACLSWLILNEIEAAAMRALRAAYPKTAVVLTLGEKGVLYEDGETACSCGAYEAPAVDTTAAGDTFTGYFLAAILRGEAPEKALQNACLASALAVSRKGASVSIPGREELDGCGFPLRPRPEF